MAGNTRIRLFRGSKAKMLEGENGEIILEDGQPFYNKTDNYLYIGDGKTSLKNIKALDVAGNVKLGTTNGTTDTTDRQPDHIFEENSNTVKLASEALKIKMADSAATIKYTTMAPTSDQPDGTLTIYIGDNTPNNLYKNVLYLTYL